MVLHEALWSWHSTVISSFLSHLNVRELFSQQDEFNIRGSAGCSVSVVKLHFQDMSRWLSGAIPEGETQAQCLKCLTASSNN